MLPLDIYSTLYHIEYIEWTHLRWGIVSENSVQSIFTPNSKMLSADEEGRESERMMCVLTQR